ncbi:MAG: HEAT repeat domain-containing protein [Planctomycetes bacterium]|nr:HEAT repeat domain-containing protein [Planctomycetota bacterium]
MMVGCGEFFVPLGQMNLLILYVISLTSAITQIDQEREKKIKIELKRLEDDNPLIRSSALQELRRLKAKEYEKEIAESLNDLDANVVINAISFLTEINATKYIDDIARYLEINNKLVKASAVYALGKLEAKKYSEQISKLLSIDENTLEKDYSQVRSAAIIALGRLARKYDDKKSAAGFEAVANEDESEEVRLHAKWAMFRNNLFTGDVRELIKDITTFILNSYVMAEARVLPLESEYLDDLVALLKNENPNIRGTAAWAAGTMGTISRLSKHESSKLIEAIEPLVKNDKECEVYNIQTQSWDKSTVSKIAKHFVDELKKTLEEQKNAKK